MKATIRILSLVGVIGMVSGCSFATKEQLAAVDAKASEAVAKAAAANDRATEAQKLAAKAAEAAKTAQAAADAAQTCCNDNKNRLDSMFEKAMRK